MILFDLCVKFHFIRFEFFNYFWEIFLFVRDSINIRQIYFELLLHHLECRRSEVFVFFLAILIFFLLFFR